MNFKTVLIDGDGVVIKKRELFSSKFSREYNIPIDKIIPFFKNEFRLCQLGKADLKKVLASYLLEWGWEKSVEDFLKYWFESNTVVDEEVMERVKSLREKGIKCYLVTDQEKYRAEYIRKDLEFGEKLDGCFFSFEVGYGKEEPEFFQKILFELSVAADNIMYFDDDEKNLKSAEQLGIKTKLCDSLEDLNVF